MLRSASKLGRLTRPFSSLPYTPSPRSSEWKTKCDGSISACHRNPCPCKADPQQVLAEHNKIVWTDDKVKEAVLKNSLFTWGASEPYFEDALYVTRAENIYLYTPERKYIDFNAGAMCANLGHRHPKIIEAITKQLSEVEYVYPCAGYTPVKGKLSALLASVMPGDLNTFFYPSTGAEANEAAIRIVRAFTGKEKIITRYRSYHGGTSGTSSLTGDPRRWYRPQLPGIIHAMGPYPNTFAWGDNLQDVTENSLNYMEEVILHEGPQNIAAIFLECITGTNGVLKPPPGYLEGIRELCNKYNILMVADEVMSGFGRTGRWFAFCHGEGVVPDVVTMAKGINGAHLPLGCVAVRDHIAQHFRKNPLGTGSTYNSHPVALASAYAGVKAILEEDIIGHVIKMEKVMQSEMERLKKKHPSLKQGRCVGLFGMLDIQKKANGEFIAPPYGALPPAMQKLRHHLFSNGLSTVVRGSNIFCIPPLIINQQQLQEAFSIIDSALYITDEAMEK